MIDRLSEYAKIQIINLDDNLFDEVTAHQSADFWNFWIDNRVLYMSAEEILQMHAWFLNVRWILSSTEELQMRDFMLRNQLSTLLQELRFVVKII